MRRYSWRVCGILLSYRGIQASVYDGQDDKHQNGTPQACEVWGITCLWIPNHDAVT